MKIIISLIIFSISVFGYSYKHLEPEEVNKPSVDYIKNTLGARIVNTLVHQYFIKGGKLGESDVEKVSFQQIADEF